MNQKMSLERRSEPRYKDLAKEPLVGRLVGFSSGSKEFDISLIDISSRGLGFLVLEKIESGLYWLMLGGEKIRSELAYCNQDVGDPGRFRCGLFVRDEIDLLEVCQNLGYINR